MRWINFGLKFGTWLTTEIKELVNCQGPRNSWTIHIEINKLDSLNEQAIANTNPKSRINDWIIKSIYFIYLVFSENIER